MATLYDLLKLMLEKKASDLHITTNTPPRIRIHGKLIPIDAAAPPLTPADTKALCYSVLTETQKQKFEESNELDFSFGLKGLSRFRGNVFMQRGATAGAFRVVPFEIKTFEQLKLPSPIRMLTERPRGMILVTGPTGSGKSTTLATIVNQINITREDHIITIEDPIEFIHQHKKCMVNQREVGADTKSFTAALKSVLRQDPDIVLIGELRDLETIEAALRVSETGHLTFGTLHTNSAIQTINRIIDVFPPHQQDQIRVQLSFVLEGVIAQQLIPTSDGKGRVMACEVMLPNAGIRNLIREDKIHQIYSMMQSGQAKYGMITMNQSLLELYLAGALNQEDAVRRSIVPDELVAMIQKAGPPRRAVGR